MTEPEAWAAHLPQNEEIKPMDKIDTSTALLPCPFCGDDLPYTDEGTCRIFGKRTCHNFAVACSNCEITSPGANTLTEAIAAWNTRALVPALLAECDDLRAKLDAAVASLDAWVELAANCSVEEGVCCCGDNMENHGDPMNCGHSPTDHGSYIAGMLVETTRAARAKIKGDTHE